MGYRSDVAYAFYSYDKEHQAVVKLWIDNNLPTKALEIFGDSSKFITQMPKNAGIVLSIEGVKWYEGYPEVEDMVKFYEEFVSLFCNDGSDTGVVAGCEFIRLGEESDDVEEEQVGDCEYVLGVSKSISYNF